MVPRGARCDHREPGSAVLRGRIPAARPARAVLQERGDSRGRSARADRLRPTSAEADSRCHPVGMSTACRDSPRRRLRWLRMPPASRTADEHLAYVIYTSGSTGQPNGVQISRGALAHFVAGATQRYGLRRDDRVLQFAPLHFDASVEEIFLTLCAGREAGGYAPMRCSSRCRGCWTPAPSAAITVLDLPTAFWHEVAYSLSTGAVSSLPPLRIGHHRRGGRAARAGRSLAAPPSGPRSVLLNTYGPTEATVVATVGHAQRRRGRRGADGGGPDRPSAARVCSRALDARGRLAAPGVRGGAVSDGRRPRRGLSRAAGADRRALRHARGACPIGHARTAPGDRVRLREDGQLVFVGRVDDEFKISGHRVDPAEVETVLLGHPGVREAAVVGQVLPGGTRRLCAHVVPDAPRAHRRRSSAGTAQRRCQRPWCPAPSCSPSGCRGPGRARSIGRRCAARFRPRSRVPAAPRPRSSERTVLRVWEQVLGSERPVGAGRLLRAGRAVAADHPGGQQALGRAGPRGPRRHGVPSPDGRRAGAGAGAGRRWQGRGAGGSPRRCSRTPSCPRTWFRSCGSHRELTSAAAGPAHRRHRLCRRAPVGSAPAPDSGRGWSAWSAPGRGSGDGAASRSPGGAAAADGGARAASAGAAGRSDAAVAGSGDRAVPRARRRVRRDLSTTPPWSASCASTAACRRSTSEGRASCCGWLPPCAPSPCTTSRRWRWRPRRTSAPRCPRTSSHRTRGCVTAISRASGWPSGWSSRRPSAACPSPSTGWAGSSARPTRGIVNTQDLVWRILLAGIPAGALPQLEVGEVWTPVDFVARALVRLCWRHSPGGVQPRSHGRRCSCPSCSAGSATIGYPVELYPVPEWRARRGGRRKHRGQPHHAGVLRPARGLGGAHLRPGDASAASG